MVKNKGVYQESEGTASPLLKSTTIQRIKPIGNQLACVSSNQVSLFSNLTSSDVITNLSVQDISSYQPDRFWLAEGTKGVRSIRKKAANSFEPLMDYLVLNGPFYNSPYRMTFQENKLYVIPGGKFLANGDGFGLRGNLMIYDLDQ